MIPKQNAQSTDGFAQYILSELGWYVGDELIFCGFSGDKVYAGGRFIGRFTEIAWNFVSQAHNEGQFTEDSISYVYQHFMKTHASEVIAAMQPKLFSNNEFLAVAGISISTSNKFKTKMIELLKDRAII